MPFERLKEATKQAEEAARLAAQRKEKEEKERLLKQYTEAKVREITEKDKHSHLNQVYVHSGIEQLTDELVILNPKLRKKVIKFDERNHHYYKIKNRTIQNELQGYLFRFLELVTSQSINENDYLSPYQIVILTWNDQKTALSTSYDEIIIGVLENGLTFVDANEQKIFAGSIKKNEAALAEAYLHPHHHAWSNRPDIIVN